MPFDAGALDLKVTLLRRQTAHDGLQLVESWTAIGTRMVSRRPLPGGERDEADARRSFSRASLWLRLDSLTGSLTAADAVAIGGQVHELIEPPREVDKFRRRGIELLVQSTGQSFAA